MSNTHADENVSIDSHQTSPDEIIVTMLAGIKVTVPAGVRFFQDLNKVTFTIEGEALELFLTGAEGSLDAAISCAKSLLYPSIKGKAPMQSVELGDVDWDEAKVDVFILEAEDKLLQFVAKRHGLFSWVVTICATRPILEKRVGQIMSLLDGLKAPNQSRLDLSRITSVSIDSHAEELDDFVRNAMVAARIPGLALAVVEDGKVAYIKGFGSRNLRGVCDVTPHTRFMIGSITKSMTTLLISKLVDQGTLSWDDKAVKLYPMFSLKDQDLARELTMKDLVCASTGISRRDIPLLVHAGKTPKDLLVDLKNLEKTTSNKIFQYNNQLVAAAGYIASKKALPDHEFDEAYYTLIQKLIFTPFEMIRTTARTSIAISDSNVSHSHCMDLNGNLQEVDFFHEKFAEYVCPSGGVWSTAQDMAHYLIAELGSGMFKGRQVVSKNGTLQRREKQVQISDNCYYGMGWMIGKNSGLDFIQHSGGTMGFSSQFIFFPEERRGMVLLSNSSCGFSIQTPIVQKVLSLWYKRDLKACKQQPKSEEFRSSPVIPTSFPK